MDLRERLKSDLCPICHKQICKNKQNCEKSYKKESYDYYDSVEYLESQVYEM